MKPIFRRTSILLVLLTLSGCSLIKPGTVEAIESPPLISEYPAGLISPTPFQPFTQTPLSTNQQFGSPTPAPLSSLAPTSTQEFSHSPTPTPFSTPWEVVNWPAPNFGTPGPTPITPVPTPMPPVQPGSSSTVNLLLLGSDRRESGSYRTDTLIIASIHPSEGSVSLISIPRDLFVYIPGWTMQRINTAFQYGERTGYPDGGAGLLKDTILYNLGIPIDHLAMVEFDGFRKIVDTLGGIDLPLACAYTDWRVIDPDDDIEDPDNWRLYTAGPGLEHMDGDTALWYARSRLKSSDFDRGRRQQEVLRAIFTRAIKVNAIPRLPQLYQQLRGSVSTDLELATILELAPLGLRLSAPEIRSYFITNKMVTSWRTPQGAAVLLPDGPAIMGMVEDALSPATEETNLRLEILVEVRNGTSNPGWDILAIERLNYAGFQAKPGPPEKEPVEKTRLIDRRLSHDPDQTTALLRVLGLPQAGLSIEPGGGNPPYQLILGEDYNPCFNPANLR
jgi:polyisoprenyl-teichoic acid--peptidoglycan teichoic acid transferase